MQYKCNVVYAKKLYRNDRVRANSSKLTKVKMSPMKHHLPCAVALLAFFLTSCAAQIPPGYTLFPNYGYYKLHTDRVTWGEGFDICRREGGELAVINSDEEAFIITGLFAQGSTIPYCYLGFHDLYKEGIYLTVNATPMEDTGYTKWGTGQPSIVDGLYDADCGGINHEGLLYSRYCDYLSPFFCEIPLAAK